MNSNGIITAPVSFGDVNAVLGTSHTDLATLCKDVNINKWARFKPVRLNVIDTITGQWDFTNNKWLNSSTWWKGYGDESCGITPPAYKTNLSQALSLYDGDMNGWVYNRPAGGARQPYRIQDFAGYNHAANPPIHDFHVPSTIIQDGQFAVIAFENVEPIDGSLSSELLLSDFANDTFTPIYFGCAFTKVVNGTITVYAKLTASQAGVASIDGDFTNATKLTLNETYAVYPFFCNQRILITETSEPSGRRYLPCPNLNPANTKIVSRSTTVNISLFAEYNSGSQTAVTITVVNGDATSRANSYVYVIPFTQDAWNNPSRYVGTAVYNSGNFTLAANQTKTISVTGLSAAQYGKYFVYATFVNGTYSKQTQILQSPPPPQM